MRLEGRTAVVTGGSTGIGRAIAARFASEGAYVVVSDVRETSINPVDGESPTLELIEQAGGRGRYVHADVSKSDDVQALIGAATEENGRLDILVNSAAVFDAHNILDTTEESWDALMDVNLKGMFLSCKAAIAQMTGQREVNEVRGRIVNVASQHGMVGPPDYCAYAVAKGGNIQLTRQLAVDHAKNGIIVNAVAPGRIVTGRHEGEREFLETGRTDADLEYALSRTPFPRLGRAEDCAGAALFLASDDCTFVSGHTLLVDGGWMAY